MADSTPTLASLLTEIGALLMEAAKLQNSPSGLAQFIENVNTYNANVVLAYPPATP